MILPITPVAQDDGIELFLGEVARALAALVAHVLVQAGRVDRSVRLAVAAPIRAVKAIHAAHPVLAVECR